MLRKPASLGKVVSMLSFLRQRLFESFLSDGRFVDRAIRLIAAMCNTLPDFTPYASSDLLAASSPLEKAQEKEKADESSSGRLTKNQPGTTMSKEGLIEREERGRELAGGDVSEELRSLRQEKEGQEGERGERARREEVEKRKDAESYALVSRWIWGWKGRGGEVGGGGGEREREEEKESRNEQLQWAYALGKLAGTEAAISFDFLVSLVMSSEAESYLMKINPFLDTGEPTED